MDDKPIRQQEIQVFRHRQVIHRDRFGEGLERHADSHMTAAQTLALPDLVSRNVFTGSVHNQVGIRTPENRTVLQFNDFEPVSIFLNTDFLCFGVHDLSSVLVIGFHHAFRHAAFHQLRKGNGRTVRQQDAGFSGEASRCAENQAVRVFVKRNFLGAGKSYMIKGKQAEKKAENALCERLKCDLVAGNIKPLPTSEKRLRQG